MRQSIQGFSIPLHPPRAFDCLLCRGVGNLTQGFLEGGEFGFSCLGEVWNLNLAWVGWEVSSLSRGMHMVVPGMEKLNGKEVALVN